MEDILRGYVGPDSPQFIDLLKNELENYLQRQKSDWVDERIISDFKGLLKLCHTSRGSINSLDLKEFISNDKAYWRVFVDVIRKFNWEIKNQSPTSFQGKCMEFVEYWQQNIVESWKKLKDEYARHGRIDQAYGEMFYSLITRDIPDLLNMHLELIKYRKSLRPLNLTMFTAPVKKGSHADVETFRKMIIKTISDFDKTYGTDYLNKGF